MEKFDGVTFVSGEFSVNVLGGEWWSKLFGGQLGAEVTLCGRSGGEQQSVHQSMKMMERGKSIPTTASRSSIRARI